MNKLPQLAAAAAVLLVSTIPAPAQAQSFYANPWLNHGLRTHRFNRVFDGRQAQIDREIANLHSRINMRLASGAISPRRAAMLNARLNMIASQAANGMSVGEFSMLQSRLANVRVAVNSGFNSRWY
jgi:hypothetical protein